MKSDALLFSFDEATRSIEIFKAEEPHLGIFMAQPALEVDGVLLESAKARSVSVEAGQATRIVLSFAEPRIEWCLQIGQLPQGNAVILGSEIVNKASREVRLGKCLLLRSRKVAIGPDKGEMVFLDCQATQYHTRVRRLSEGDGRHLTKIIGHIYNRSLPLALHSAFVTYDRVNTEHAFSYKEGKGIVSLDSYCDFEGFRLQQGEAIRSETLVVEMRSNPYASLESWAERVQSYYRPCFPPKNPTGWVGWAWVDGFTVERCEEVVLRNAKALQRRLQGFGLEYIWVSIGNLKDGLPGNWLEFNTKNFPSGVKALVARLRRLGFKLGFWVAPFWICSYLKDKVEEFNECLLRQADGSLLVTRSEWQYGVAGTMPKGQRPVCYALDGSHPKTIAWLKHVFSTYRKWGIRYYMIDFLEAGSGSTPGRYNYADYYDHRLVKGPEVYRNAIRAIREAAGYDTYLLASSGPTLHNVGLVDAVRTGNDYGEGRPLYTDSYFYPATFVINNPAFWTSHMYASNNMAAFYFTHRKLYINDSGNVMTVDKPIPMNDAQITATLFGINGGPMMIGDDVERICDERLALIKKCLPRTNEVAFPVDLFDSVAPDYPKVFHLKINTSWDEWHIVAVLNYDDEPRKEFIKFSALGIEDGTNYTVWEFWNEQYLGVKKDSFVAMLPPRSARLYRLRKERSYPWLLSTDMHTLQGKVEILDCVWDAKSMTLSGKAFRPKGELGNIYIRVPQGLRLAKPKGHWIAKDAHEGVLIVRRPLIFNGKPVRWAIRFTPIQSRKG